jgi:hypothetical protein
MANEEASGILEHSNSRRALWFVSTIAPVVAPVTVILAGMLYLAGWAYQRSLLRFFGLADGLLNMSVQRTLALGYIPVFVGTLVALVAVFLIWQGTRLMRRPPAYLMEGPFGKANGLIARINRANTVMFIAVILLSYGYVAGALQGRLHGRDEAQIVEDGCQDGCFRYYVGARGVVGRVVAQDEKRTILYTRLGALIVENSQIKAVQPMHPLSEESIWEPDNK